VHEPYKTGDILFKTLPAFTFICAVCDRAGIVKKEVTQIKTSDRNILLTGCDNFIVSKIIVK